MTSLDYQPLTVEERDELIKTLVDWICDNHKPMTEIEKQDFYDIAVDRFEPYISDGR